MRPRVLAPWPSENSESPNISPVELEKVFGVLRVNGDTVFRLSGYISMPPFI